MTDPAIGAPTDSHYAYVTPSLPSRGELIRHSSGIEFEVVEADPRRVRLLRVRHLPTESPAHVGED